MSLQATAWAMEARDLWCGSKLLLITLASSSSIDNEASIADPQLIDRCGFRDFRELDLAKGELEQAGYVRSLGRRADNLGERFLLLVEGQGDEPKPRPRPILKRFRVIDNGGEGEGC